MTWFSAGNYYMGALKVFDLQSQSEWMIGYMLVWEYRDHQI